ncbi:MAG: class I SAM-dependent methyltransferase [Solibacillus sp.]|uniref:class I SAM-dependent methyltransferase n=1 Tax=unclassified Solibacillus TaxID=2637870 RepID=UPI0030FA205D
MKEIIDYYEQFDEWGRLDREPLEFHVNWHYIKKYLPVKGRILDNGAGPGKYSMALAKEGFRVTLTDLTPKLVEVAEAKAIELKLENQFSEFIVADARKLEQIEDEQFDATLMLGPMYHLQQEVDRIIALKELNRVTKKDGIVFVAFMPRTKHIFNSLINPENWRPNDSMIEIEQFSKSGCFNHSEVNRFTGAYYFDIDEIQPLMESQGFQCIQLIGSNIATSMTKESWNYWKLKGEEQKVLDLIIKKAADPYLLGMSSHLLYIGRKTK